MSSPNAITSREEWLKSATTALRSRFTAAGYPLPDTIRFAIAFPSTGRKGKRIGEHWHADASDDHHHEIFIRADQADPLMVLGILCHELTHAAVPLGSGHGKVFKAAATAIGLEGKMIHALPGPALNTTLADLSAELGPLPHARLNLDGASNDRPKKQTARLIKCECDACGYIVRTARKWIEEKGPPLCPEHGRMSADLPDDDSEEE